MRLPVLLLDDDQDWLRVCLARLPQTGYALEPTVSLPDALERLASVRYPVVVCDLRLIGFGEQGGFRLLDKARTISKFTQVIIVTAYGGAATNIALKAMEKGASTYLTKPIDFLELDECVVMAIEAWRQKVEEVVNLGFFGKGPELEFLRMLGVEIPIVPHEFPRVTVQPDASITRICTADGEVVGAGFLVGERLVLTCAHVVNIALGLPQDAQNLPKTDVQVDFPLVAPGQLLSACVNRWQPAADVAGLKLTQAPPPGTRSVGLITATDTWGHTFRAFGFPGGHKDGVWSVGVLRGRRADGWLQVEDTKETGYRIAPGFSGSPVWDELLNGVAGMVVAAETREHVKAAFLIPTDVLLKAWPDLARG
jgi:CheY-like chemotaxis protein